MNLYPKEIFLKKGGPEYDNFSSKMWEISVWNYVNTNCFQQLDYRFLISMIYSLSTGCFRFLIFFFLLFYLVRFNSSFQNFAQLGFYDIKIKITTSRSGREHKSVRNWRTGRNTSGSNPGHDQQFFLCFSLNFHCPNLSSTWYRIARGCTKAKPCDIRM